MLRLVSRLRCNASVSEQMTAFQKHVVIALLWREMRTRDAGGGPCPAFAGAVVFRLYSPSPSTLSWKAMPPSPALGTTLPHRTGKEESLGVSVMPSPQQSLSYVHCPLRQAYVGYHHTPLSAGPLGRSVAVTTLGHLPPSYELNRIF